MYTAERTMDPSRIRCPTLVYSTLPMTTRAKHPPLIGWLVGCRITDVFVRMSATKQEAGASPVALSPSLRDVSSSPLPIGNPRRMFILPIEILRHVYPSTTNTEDSCRTGSTSHRTSLQYKDHNGLPLLVLVPGL